MKVLLILLTMIAFGAGDVAAQMSQEEVAIIQNVYGMEKREIYREVMDMSPGDSVAFWPIYDQYEMDRQALGKRRIHLMEQFVAKYPAITAEEIDEIVEESADLKEDLNELTKDAYDDIKDAASVMTAAKFYQIEGFLNTVVQAALAVKLPFIGEFHMKAAEKK